MTQIACQAALRELARSGPPPPLLAGATGLEKTGWLLGGLVDMVLLLTTRDFLPSSMRDELFYPGLAAAAMVVTGWGVGMGGSRGG